jgi:hypothetical protein
VLDDKLADTALLLSSLFLPQRKRNGRIKKINIYHASSSFYYKETPSPFFSEH